MRALIVLLIIAAGSGLPAAAAAPVPFASPTLVIVEMHDFRFRPSVIRIPSGRPVILRLINRGQLAHQMQSRAFLETPVTIVSGGSYVEAPGLEIFRLQPGAQGDLRFTPRARGRVRFTCTIEGHAEAGMIGTFDLR